MILSVINQKGGVGKTTTALNVAASLAQSGVRTLLIDLDPQANASSQLNVRASETIFDALVDAEVTVASIVVPTPVAHLYLAPAHRALAGLDGAMGYNPNKVFRLDTLLKPLSDYDAIIIDTAPAPLFSPSGMAAGMALVASDIALVALAVEELAVEGLGQVLHSIRDAQDERMNPRLQMRIAVTMADARRADAKTIEQAMRARFGTAVYQTVIPRLAEIARGLSNREQGGAVVTFAPKSQGALAYNALAREIALDNGLMLPPLERSAGKSLAEVACG